MQYKVVKSPSEQLSLTNCVIVNKNDFNPDLVKFMKKIVYVKRQHKMPHLQVQVPKTLLETFLCTLKIFGVKLGMIIQRQFIEITWESKKFIFGIKAGGVNTQEIGFSFIQRKWTTVVLQSTVEAKPHLFDKTKTLVESMILDVDFLQKAKSTQEAYDTDKMATDFTVSFQSLPFTIGQPVVFNIEGKPYLVLTVKDLAVADPTAALGTKSKTDTTSKKRVNCGILMSNTHITFEKAEESKVVLKGKARGRSSMPSIINPDWDFTDMGIGGLDKEFSAIFRRAFASRVFPPEVVEQFGLKHVKGILLFGPPGCGKTLMARQIGTMLNAREPKIVNGPEILNKYVGESEANIRNLFSDAITEQKQAGLDSGLHMIIFDEIDAICKQRGSMSGSTGVHDTVVNQLLSMIDGVEQLNNILVIGMTNRKDLIDEALLRPGRLEVQMEIGLPSQEGRLQILNIHTAKLRNEKKLSEDVSLEVLSVETKNFSGAEIEGLVRAAATTSMNKLVKVEGKVSIDPDAIENLKISREDFELALANDIKPSFGADTEDFENYVANGIVMWGTPVKKVFEDCKLLLNQTRHGELISPVSVLLEGCQGGGKTALAANLAQISDFPFIKICSPQKMVGYSETAKCQAIKKVFDDAYKSELSCVVVDDIERLIDYVPIGPRFSNLVLQALMVLLKRSLPKGRKLLIIGTTSCRDVLEQMQLLQVFNTVVHVPSITKPDQLMEVVKKLNYFDEAELEFIKSGIAEMNINIGIKKLLSLVEMAIQTDIGMRAEKFQVLLQEQSW